MSFLFGGVIVVAMPQYHEFSIRCQTVPSVLSCEIRVSLLLCVKISRLHSCPFVFIRGLIFSGFSKIRVDPCNPWLKLCVFPPSRLCVKIPARERPPHQSPPLLEHEPHSWQTHRAGE